MVDCSDKVIIVTGAGKGIGKSIAEFLASKGCYVVVNSLTKKNAEYVSSKINEQNNSHAIAVQADIRKEEDVKKLVNAAIRHFNRIDVLINNAGVVIEKKLADTTKEEFDWVIDTNLKGVFLCKKAVLPHMLCNKSGQIINIGSGAGKNGFYGLSSYCASKFGLLGLSESLQKELAGTGIYVTTICPGAVATDMQKQFMSQEEFDSKSKSMIQPEKIAQTVWNVISDSKSRKRLTIDMH